MATKAPNSGFKTPKGYFANLDGILQNKLPKPDKAQSGFVVPAQYFSTLKSPIKLNKTSKYRLLQTPILWVAAASIALFISVYFWDYSSASTLTNTEIANYLDTQTANWDWFDFIEFIPPQDTLFELNLNTEILTDYLDATLDEDTEIFNFLDPSIL